MEKLIQARRDSSDLIKQAWLGSIIYIVVMGVGAFIFAGINGTLFKFNYDLNQFGDYFAGIFSPLGVLWIVQGYRIQANEFKRQSGELEKQSQELKTQTEQLKRQVESNQKLVNQSLREAEERRRLAKPILQANYHRHGAGFGADPEEPLHKVVLRNLRGEAYEVLVTAFSLTGESKCNQSLDVIGENRKEVETNVPEEENICVLVACTTKKLDRAFFYHVKDAYIKPNAGFEEISKDMYDKLMTAAIHNKDKSDIVRQFSTDVGQKFSEVFIAATRGSDNSLNE